jgi:ubiquinone biosynthesis protein UbiJ
MIKKYTLLALQKAINHALLLDEATLVKLHKLNGKSLELIISPLKVCFFIVFKDNKLCLLDRYEHIPDVTIHSSPIGLIRLSLLPSSKVRSLFNDKVKIYGNIALGQEIKKLFDEIDIDWEGHLAELTGDVVAHQIGNLVRGGRAFKRKVQDSFSRNVSEYLHEEIREFPPREEVNDFYNEVDDLNLRTDRLSAHINKLLAKYDGN